MRRAEQAEQLELPACSPQAAPNCIVPLSFPRGAASALSTSVHETFFIHEDVSPSFCRPPTRPPARALQAAIADRFKEVVEAFDVLSDEAQRAVYDKIRDYRVGAHGAT